MTKGLDLATIFKAVTGTLTQNKTELNKADDYNHNHGDNMVEIFNLIQNSVAKKNTSTPSAQLAYAAKQLQAKATSGSAKAYAENLSSASTSLKGKQLSPDTVGVLIQSLMGLNQPAEKQASSSTGADLLGSLLSGLGTQATSQNTRPEGDSNLLGSLLSGLTGQQSQDGDGLDMADVLKAGMAFYGAKQQGSSNLEAVMGALSASSNLGQSEHRKQSGALIINTITNLVDSMKK